MQKILKNVRFLNVKTRKIEFLDYANLEDCKLKEAEPCEEACDVQNFLFIPKLVSNFSDIERVKSNALPHVKKSENELIYSFFKNCSCNNFVPWSKDERVLIGNINQQNVMYFENIADFSDEELDLLLRLSIEEFRLPIIKTAYSLYDCGAVDKAFGRSAVKVLDDFGFFDRPCMIVGASEVDKDDLEILANSDVKICLCVNECLYGCLGLANVVNFKNYGLFVMLGIGDFLQGDMFAEMRNLLLFSRNLLASDEFCEWDAFEIATNSIFVKPEYFAVRIDKFKATSSEEILSNLFWKFDKSDVVQIE